MEKIGANVFVETVYPGVNIGCIVTDHGSICVDTPLLPGEAQRWQTLIHSLEGKPVRFVVYTSGQSDRSLGTQYLLSDQSKHKSYPRLGMGKGKVVAQRGAWEKLKDLSTDNFKQSMKEKFADRDPDIVNLRVMLPEIMVDRQAKLCMGEHVVSLLAAASGMLWLWLPEQGVLFVGDTIVVGTHPPLGVTLTAEWLTALARLRQDPRFQDAIIVPGRGPVCDISATEPLIAYLQLARARTANLYQAGRPKGDLNEVAVDLLPLYTIADGQRERVQRQIRMGLDILYDEFKAADVASS